MNHSAKCFNMSTYLIVFILVWDLESVHSSDHGLHGCEDVLIHQFGKAPLVFIRVSWPMDDPHLLDEGTLATLSCPWNENGSSALDHNSFAGLRITKLDTSPDFADTKRPAERSTHRKSKRHLQRTLGKLWWSISKANEPKNHSHLRKSMSINLPNTNL